MTKRTPRVGAVIQLELALHDKRVQIPWEGRSPRGLTRAFERFNLTPQGAPLYGRSGDCDQYDLWPAIDKAAPHVWGGSPSLLPLN